MGGCCVIALRLAKHPLTKDGDIGSIRHLLEAHEVVGEING